MVQFLVEVNVSLGGLMVIVKNIAIANTGPTSFRAVQAGSVVTKELPIVSRTLNGSIAYVGDDCARLECFSIQVNQFVNLGDFVLVSKV